MKNKKRALIKLAAMIGLSMGHAVHAQTLVFDASTFGEAVAMSSSLAEQLNNMTQQLQQLQQQYNSLNGVRGMASLVNNPALRQYLPADYETILNGGYGNSADIRAASKVYDVNQTTLDPNSDAAQAFNSNANQAALNRATAESAYSQASQRFASIQVLLDRINASPDAKDIADLQARIQAEQVMLQNESLKLAMLSQLAQAQRDLATQKAIEIEMKATQGAIPRF
jgi:type IV secretion system protein VirB5